MDSSQDVRVGGVSNGATVQHWCAFVLGPDSLPTVLQCCIYTGIQELDPFAGQRIAQWKRGGPNSCSGSVADPLAVVHYRSTVLSRRVVISRARVYL